MREFEPLLHDPRLNELCERLASSNGPVSAIGLWGSSAPLLAALAADRLQRPLLLVTAHGDDADDFRDDIETILGRAPELLPQLDTLPGEAEVDDELSAERLRLCIALLEDAAGQRTPASPRLITAPIHALMQPVPSPKLIRDTSRTIAVSDTLEPEALESWLVERGFDRCDQVETPGDFARRGGIVDVFCDAYRQPVRIEFFGDEVDSIRLFDAGTQRSADAIQSARIPARKLGTHDDPAPRSGRKRSAAPPRDDDTTASFLSLLPADTLIAFHEPGEIQEIGRAFWQRIGERAGIVTADAVFRKANDFAQLHLLRFDTGVTEPLDFRVRSLPQFEARATDSLPALSELAAETNVVVLCDNAAEKQRFGELLVEREVDTSRIALAVGLLHRGFRWNDTAYVPHHELFQRYRQRRTLRRVAPARPIDSFFDLSAGDYVVHAVHGIGRFRGLESVEREGRRDEYLAIEFADDAVVHVPVSQIHVVQKYIGSARGKPRLSKLGGSAWKRTKERVAEAVTDMAGDLLRVQAERAARPGVAYPEDTAWQKEFEGAFLYTETEDQLRALSEIKRDMNRARPMDRLLCGDVGYGKTELAIRAAFKTVEYGKQVAVLAPTTVLVEQHHQTFLERLADYPFRIDVLSRFRTKAEQSRIIERAKRGEVDILIGTHRLLSNDVRFADLGLLVIDEEQRFGVDAKEQLKRMRPSVDVLTLSATPIPRTLHLSMLGIRDISSLATAPVDRRSIVTQVRMWDDQLIRDAILRELNRDGQVYFVHNFVRDIHNVANHVRSLVPEARIVVGHGQMKGHELEEVMLAFLNREADVLVSTTIIESGLDIAAANTIFINRAERFGLAELHQLRGRVGRSKHRAYAYLMLSPKHPVKDAAAKRLKAIEHYSELGAGFQIAMRDLEIRGAGNILGAEQSGHIEAVGYEMYCQLLDQAVKRMKNEPADEWRPVNLELGVTAHIPRAYIRAEKQRMEVYKRLASCRTLIDVNTLASDLRDAFGPPPTDVETLLVQAEIRVLAQRWGIRSIVLDPPDVIFGVADLRQVQPLFANGPGSPRLPDPHTVHWRLPPRLMQPASLLNVLRRQLAGEDAATPQSAATA